MTRAAAFSATYADWKLIKTRSVVQVVLEIPLDQADLAYQVLGGMPDPGEERWLGVARLDGATLPDAPVEAVGPMPSEGGKDRPHKPRKPVAAEKKLAQQAGICCADPVFQQFLLEAGCIETKSEDEASVYVRYYCKVGTRASIVQGSRHGALWIDLHGRFEAWKLVAA